MNRFEEAERLLIGRLLLSSSEYYQAADLLTAADFKDPTWAQVYAVIAGIAEDGLPVNRLSLQARLGSAYPDLRPRLAEAYEQGQVAGSTSALAEVVLEGARRRRAQQLAERLATAAFSDQADIVAVSAQVAGELLGTAPTNEQESAGAVATRLVQRLEDWERVPLEPGQVRGLSTGLRNLDVLTGGLLPGYHIVAGRAGMGKTALALQIAANVARRGYPVFYLTFEIAPDLLLTRLASALSGVPVIDGYTHNLDRADNASLREAVRRVGEWPLEFYHGSALLSQVIAALHRAARTLKPALVVIDNLGHLMVGERVQREYEELNQSSRRIKETANALGLPILALHQLSRGPEARENKMPTMADLRGSGHLEQDADTVWLLYRPAYYSAGPDTEFQAAVAKNRLTGRTGSTLLYFEPCAGIKDAVLPVVR